MMDSNELQAKTNKTAEYIERMLKEAISLYRQKNVAYGDSFRCGVEKYGVVSAIIRLNDKLQRVESLLLYKNRNDVKDESVIDTLVDLSLYSMMLTYELTDGCLRKSEDLPETTSFKTDS